MTISGILSHDDLLTLARKVEAAAADGDRERVLYTAAHMFDHLREHIAAERANLHRLAPRDERLLGHGQRRVADVALELAIAAETAPEECRCETLALELLALLEEQADDERLAGVPPIGTALAP